MPTIVIVTFLPLMEGNVVGENDLVIERNLGSDEIKGWNDQRE